MTDSVSPRNPGFEEAVEVVARLAYERYAPIGNPPWEELEQIGDDAIVPLLTYRQFGKSVITALLDGRVPGTVPLVILDPEQVRRADFTDVDDGMLHSGEPTVPLFRRREK